MVGVLKAVVGLVGLITLAIYFPFIHGIFDLAAGNSTNPGMLYLSGSDNVGNPIYTSNTNTTIIRFAPYLWPVIFFIAIIVYVVTTRGRKPE